MVHGRPHEGQTEVGRDALFKPVNLNRDMALVMVHAQHCIVLVLDGLVENYVGWHRADGVDSFLFGGLDRGGDFLCFFVTQEAAVAAVGVQSCGCDPGY